MSPDRLVRLPRPADHVSGTLRLLERFRELGHRVPSILEELVDRPVPASAPPRDSAMKYDAYLGPRGAWGLAAGDLWEPESFPAVVEGLVEALGAPYDLEAAWRFREGLRPNGIVAALGFDRPGAPPRLKIYFQERAWGQGVCQAEELDLPFSGPAGVVTMELFADGRRALKAYLGGATPAAAARGVPVPPIPTGLPGWYYLTVRKRPEEPLRYSINKIYNHVQLAFTEEGELDAAWAEAAAGFPELRAPGLLVVPTAIARQEEGADLYVAAWSSGTVE